MLRGSGCPHGNGDPSQCSQCIGAPARRVAVVAGAVEIDGVRVSSSAAQQRDAEDAMAVSTRQQRKRRR
jgi:hypothetical protein